LEQWVRPSQPSPKPKTLGGQRMKVRARNGWLDLAAHAVGAPSIAAAFVLYVLVSWVPDALYKRNLMCAFFVLAGVGAGFVHARVGASRVRYAGAIAMVLGLAGVVVVGKW
jgi:hypothetical protein